MSADGVEKPHLTLRLLPCGMCDSRHLTDSDLINHRTQQHPVEVCHYAASIGNLNQLEMVAKLHPECLNSLDQNGMPSLHLAASNGHFDAAEFLLNFGAEVNLVAPLVGLTALHIAAGNNHLEIVKLLLARGARVDELSQWGTALHIAGGSGYAAIVQVLLSANADPNIVRSVDGSTALHYAVRKGMEGRDSALALLEGGVRPNAQNHQGEAAMHLAVGFGLKEVVKILIAKGGDFELLWNCEGYSPIHLAAFHGQAEILDLFLRSSTNPEASLRLRNGIGENLLHMAVRNGHKAACEVLLKAGADPNELRADGLGPVHFVESGEILLLLKSSRRCNIHQSTSKGFSALNLAIGRGNREVGGLLIRFGADVNACDGTGYSPLNLAMSNADENFVGMLVTRGADCNLRDRRGNSPAGWIPNYVTKQLRLLQALRSYGANLNGMNEDEKERIKAIEDAARDLTRAGTTNMDNVNQLRRRSGKKSVNFDLDGISEE